MLPFANPNLNLAETAGGRGESRVVYFGVPIVGLTISVKMLLNFVGPGYKEIVEVPHRFKIFGVRLIHLVSEEISVILS